MAKTRIRGLGVIFLALLQTGFYAFAEIRWAISPSEPTLWIKMEETPDFKSYDFPGGDPLNGATDLDYDKVFQALLDDINNVGASYLRVAKYPDDPDNPGDPEEGDSEFTKDKASGRTITVKFGGAPTSVGLGGGHADLDFSGETITNCTVELKGGLKDNAKNFTRTLLHELGHCFGLGHPQQIVGSIMSYFRTEDKVRLFEDDKMGITFLYPKDTSYNDETLTLGFGCGG